MIHPLIKLLATQPQLVAEHLGGYAALFGAEVHEVKNRLLVQLLLSGLALCLLGVATVLGGVAAMLWVLAPEPLSSAARWTLVLVPLAPVTGAAVAFAFARRSVTDQAFATMQNQLDADARMLNEVGAL